MERDHKGRFIKGNQVSRRGWQALVEKRFGGNERLAREWWGRIGAHTYARMADIGFIRASFAHPGTPEDFVRQHGSK